MSSFFQIGLLLRHYQLKFGSQNLCLQIELVKLFVGPSQCFDCFPWVDCTPHTSDPRNASQIWRPKPTMECEGCNWHWKMRLGSLVPMETKRNEFNPQHRMRSWLGQLLAWCGRQAISSQDKMWMFCFLTGRKIIFLHEIPIFQLLYDGLFMPSMIQNVGFFSTKQFGRAANMNNQIWLWSCIFDLYFSIIEFSGSIWIYSTMLRCTRKKVCRRVILFCVLFGVEFCHGDPAFMASPSHFFGKKIIHVFSGHPLRNFGFHFLFFSQTPVGEWDTLALFQPPQGHQVARKQNTKVPNGILQKTNAVHLCHSKIIFCDISTTFREDPKDKRNESQKGENCATLQNPEAYFQIQLYVSFRYQLFSWNSCVLNPCSCDLLPCVPVTLCWPGVLVSTQTPVGYVPCQVICSCPWATRSSGAGLVCQWHVEEGSRSNSQGER